MWECLRKAAEKGSTITVNTLALGMHIEFKFNGIDGTLIFYCTQDARCLTLHGQAATKLVPVIGGQRTTAYSAG